MSRSASLLLCRPLLREAARLSWDLPRQRYIETDSLSFFSSEEGAVAFTGASQ